MKKNKKYPIDYRKGSIKCPNIEQRIGKTLSSHAYTFGLDYVFDGLYESDIQWIENNITKNSQNNIRDIFWKQDGYTHKTHKNKYILDYRATFFELFIDAPGIPLNVKRLLIYTVGIMRAHYDMKIEVDPYQHFFVERWMETCR